MKYMSLDQRGQVQAEYIWIDAVGGTRSKTKVSHILVSAVSFLAPLFLVAGWDWLCRYRWIGVFR